MTKCCSHGTLLHFGLQSSHLNICYYHQDLHYTLFHPDSRQRLLHRCPRPLTHHDLIFAGWLSIGTATSAPSIFRASSFGRWVVTHSLADSDFHGHRPAVYMNQHLLWYLMSRAFGHLNSTLGSSLIASSAYQKWPTWNMHSSHEFN